MSPVGNIAIIGGGYTGLAAAYDLSLHHRVTLFERSNTLGGLAGDFTIAGTPLERAYHHLFRSDRAILELCEELGIDDRIRWLPAKMDLYRGGQMHPFSGPIDLLRFAPLSPLARLRLSATMWRLSRRTDWQTLAGISAAEWIRQQAGEQPYRELWEPLLKAKFHAHHAEISMAWLWARIHIRARSRSNPLGREKLGYPEGGFTTITRALVSALEARGMNLRMSQQVQSLRQLDDGRIALTSEQQTSLFDQVLVTTPSPVLSQLLPPDDPYLLPFREILARTRYLAAVTCIFTSSQRLTEAYWTSIADPEYPFLVLLNHTALVSPAEFGGRHVYYLGQYLPEQHTDFMDSDSAIKTRWFRALNRILPQFDENEVGETHLFRFRFAQHVVTTRHGENSPPVQTPWPALFLANFSQTFPEDRGTNFAIRDGRRVARLMINALARRCNSHLD